MPCSDAMITEVISARPDQTVSEALALFNKHGIRSVPVVDEKNAVVGVFSFSHLLYALLPVSSTLGDSILRLKHMDISLDHLSGASPWVAKRLNILLPQKLEEVMLKNPKVVRPETPLREGIRLMVKYDSPLPVVKDESNALVGIISSQSTLTVLTNMAAHLAEGKEVHE